LHPSFGNTLAILYQVPELLTPSSFLIVITTTVIIVQSPQLSDNLNACHIYPTLKPYRVWGQKPTSQAYSA
jgi:hypothetical protein